MSEAGIVVNLVFMVLNLLPILPLDGGRIVAEPAAAPRCLAVREARAAGAFRSCCCSCCSTNVLGIVLQPLVGAVGPR